jgi:hypothetical protein
MKPLAALLFAAFFTWLTAWAAGKWLVRALRVQLHRTEEWFLCFAAGTACLSMLVFLLTAAHLAYTGVFLALGAAIILAAWLTGALRTEAPPLPALARPLRLAFAAIYLPFAVYYLCNAMIPESSPDGLVYHVAFPARYLREHGFPAHPENLLMHLSQGMEMLYLFAFSIGRHSAPALVHLLFALLMPFGILSYARRIGHPTAGVVAALLYFASPIVGRDGTTSYIDVGAGAAVFASFCFLEIWREDRALRTAALAGLAAGFAYGIKYTAGLALPFALLWIALHRPHRQLVRALASAAFAASLMMLPWMVKNALTTGNPFAPFGNAFFPNADVYVTTERNYQASMRHLNALTPAQVPLELTVRGGRLQGLLGPVFLLLPLAILALRRPEGRRLLAAAAVFSLTYPAAVACRFLIPPLPFAALAFGLAIGEWLPLLLGVVVLHAVLSWPAVVNRYADRYGWRLEEFPWKTALRIYPQEDYLKSSVIDYNIGRIIDKEVPKDEAVFSFSGIQTAWHTREILSMWTSARSTRIGEALQAPFNPDFKPIHVHRFRFPARQTGLIRLTQTGAGSGESWTISELRVYRDGVEVPRRRKWEAAAWPNPWDAPLAVDGNPLTRWTSGQPHRPGMSFHLQMDSTTVIDEVRLESAGDPSPIQLRLESYDAWWRIWGTISTAAELTVIAPPDHMRHAAIDYLKRNNLRWLLVYDSDMGARDFLQRPAEWGLRLVANTGGYQLYRVAE